MNQKDILDMVASSAGLYEKIFWKLLNSLVFKQKYENQKHVLKTVFKYKDVDEIFAKQIERKEFTGLSKIIFRFQWEEKRGIFWQKKDE